MATSGKNNSDNMKSFGYQINFFDNLLGHGGFGTVYMGQNDAGTTFAIKRVSKTNKKHASTEAVKAHFLKQKINNDYVVKVHDVKAWKDSMWIVMEYCDLGDLNNFFEKYQQNLDTKGRFNIMAQIAKGIAFLHDKNIVHRDIKPGNILLKRNATHAIVKLGDFGLSKILDPDDLTSTMSSNVGTLVFKAPEFWDKGPDDRVRYHRNVDVYAAGLTFTAMLQARVGSSLVPKVEGSLLSSERKMPIGLAAFNRHQNKHNEIQVVVQDENNTPLVENLKFIIERMTCFSPSARITASEVEERFDVMKREVKIMLYFYDGNVTKIIHQYFNCIVTELSASIFQFPDAQPHTLIPITSHFNVTGENVIMHSMCYIKDNLVTTLYLPEKWTYKTRVYDEKYNLVKRWKPCHTVHSMLEIEIQGKEYMLEGCAMCEMIRGYEFPQIERKILCEGISPDAMCKGPGGTILVFNAGQRIQSIKQLSFCNGQFLPQKEIYVACADIRRLCFSENSSIVIVLHNRKTLTGFHFPTGQVAWQHSEIQLRSSSGVLTDFQHILTLPDGRVCVFTHKEIFALNPFDGTILYMLHRFEKPGVITAATTSYNGKQQKLAVCTFPMTLSVYDVPFGPHNVTHFLPLKDIVSDEEDIETDR